MTISGSVLTISPKLFSGGKATIQVVHFNQIACFTIDTVYNVEFESTEFFTVSDYKTTFQTTDPRTATLTIPEVGLDPTRNIKSGKYRLIITSAFEWATTDEFLIVETSSFGTVMDMMSAISVLSGLHRFPFFYSRLWTEKYLLKEGDEIEVGKPDPIFVDKCLPISLPIQSISLVPVDMIFNFKFRLRRANKLKFVIIDFKPIVKIPYFSSSKIKLIRNIMGKSKFNLKSGDFVAILVSTDSDMYVSDYLMLE